MRYIILGIGETMFVSRHRILTACGWILAAVLCLGYAFSIVLSPAFALFARGVLGLRGWWVLLAGASLVLAAVCFLFCVTTARALVRMGWDHTRRFRQVTTLTLVLLLWILVLHLRRDAAPLPGDYTLEDVPASARAAESHALFAAAFPGGERALSPPPAVCAVSTDCTNATADHVGAIQQAWQDLADTRGLLKQLSAFDGIGDLATPGHDPEESLRTISIRNYAQVTWAFCSHQAVRGEAQAAARELALFHSVIRKALPYSRSLIRKMMLVAVAKGNLRVAERLLDDPEHVEQVAGILRSAFSPLTKDEVSLCGPFVFEYLAVRDRLQEAGLDQFLCLAMDELAAGTPGSEMDTAPRRMLLSLLYNRNRTVRTLSRDWERYIRAAGEPGGDPVASAEVKVPWGIWVKNPGGSVLVNRVSFDAAALIQAAEALRGRSEKLAALLDDDD